MLVDLRPEHTIGIKDWDVNYLLLVLAFSKGKVWQLFGTRLLLQVVGLRFEGFGFGSGAPPSIQVFLGFLSTSDLLLLKL